MSLIIFESVILYSLKPSNTLRFLFQESAESSGPVKSSTYQVCFPILASN